MSTDNLELLLKIQELELVLHESGIVHGDDHEHDTDNIHDEIKKLRAQISESILVRYDRHRENGLGVVKELNGYCKACHITIPVGDLSRMRNNAIEKICPNCSAFLVLSEVK